MTVPYLLPWGARGALTGFLSWCHLIGAVSPWIGSFLYHVFMNLNYGEAVYRCLLKLDMLGIWICQSIGNVCSASDAIRSIDRSASPSPRGRRKSPRRSSIIETCHPFSPANRGLPLLDFKGSAGDSCAARFCLLTRSIENSLGAPGARIRQWGGALILCSPAEFRNKIRSMRMNGRSGTRAGRDARRGNFFKSVSMSRDV